MHLEVFLGVILANNRVPEKKRVDISNVKYEN